MIPLVRDRRAIDVLVNLRNHGADTPAYRVNDGSLAEIVVEGLHGEDAEVIQGDGDFGQGHSDGV